ncbi:MAG: TRAP transporter large permease subunit [Lachnospiraceae bacterium]|nr:TRAP transporter large permease subunit [Lachnospiraceae bacterium]MCH4032317.1 TRAP transporter large permease subunit [Lachnospiraceae bacterium]MCH4108805.1 TRAP transporter large permease subunit [Lachnospiraceae bacterium]MCI1302336.1 TRAP transporter large permease subunit [Lachnospiraceae bacterium]MCI1331501.1 TRAP transporter large permease subunit [Lachnospiraceae bacterium]
MITAILFVSFFVLLLIGMPIALCLGLSSMLAILYAMNFVPQYQTLTLSIIATNTYTGIAKFLLLAIPFFVLSGNIMAKAGISRRLVSFIDDLIGHKRGGMAMTCVVVACFFGAISGSGPATVAALGAVLVPAMIASGFSPAFSEALLAASSSIAIVIPPSIAFVVYASIVGANVGDMFMAGIIPGILMGVALCIVVAIEARKKNIQPVHEKRSGAERWKSFRDAFWGILMPVIILGGIYGGIFTPTEAAAVSVVYGLIIGMFVYKEISWRDLWGLLVDSAKTSGGILLIVASASLFSYCCTLFGISAASQALLASVATNKVVFLLIVNVIFLIAGCFIDANSAMYIFIPVMAPVAQQLGYSLIAFGVLSTVNLAIGQVTPPVGVNLFVAMGLKVKETARSVKDKFVHVTLPQISRAVVPMIAACLAVLVVVTYIPQVSLLFVHDAGTSGSTASTLTENGLSYHDYEDSSQYDAGLNAAAYTGSDPWPATTWNFDCSPGEACTWAQAGYYFNALMQQSTGGQFKVDVYPGEQLTNGDQVAGIQALMDGDTIQCSFHSNLIYANFDPRFNAVSLPFLYSDYSDVDAIMNGAGGQEMKDALAEYGLVCEGAGENGFRQLTNSRHAVKSMDDLRNLKIRISSNDLCAQIYKAWNCSATAMNWSETYTALQQGTIDGQENPETSIDSASVQDVQSYISLWNAYYDCIFFCINQKAYDQFTDAQKAIIDENAQKAVAYQIAINRADVEKLVDEWKSSGVMEVTTADEMDLTAMKEASQSVYDWYEKQLETEKGMSEKEAANFVAAFRTQQ